MMPFRYLYLLVGLFAILSLQNKAAEGTQATIFDTGSTNRPGLQVTIDANGNAKVEPRGVEPRTMRLSSNLCQRFLLTLQSAASLHALPAARCVKSASFGSRLFIDYKGERTPDLSCPVQQDPNVEDLKQQALAILQKAKVASASRRF